MKALSLREDHMVVCRYCGKQHVINGFDGNNIGWKDKDCWKGNGYDARGFIETEKVDAICPECQNTDEIMLEAQEAVNKGIFNSVEEYIYMFVE